MRVSTFDMNTGGMVFGYLVSIYPHFVAGRRFFKVELDDGRTVVRRAENVVALGQTAKIALTGDARM